MFDISSLLAGQLIEGSSVTSDDGPLRRKLVSRDAQSRLKPAEDFFKSSLAKRVLGFLQQAKDEKEATKGDGPPAKDYGKAKTEGPVESLVGWLLDGGSVCEGLGLLEPGHVASEGSYQPSMDEYFNALILRINTLDLLDYYLTASIESDLDAVLLFFDSSMEENQAARLLSSFREILPGSQVIQKPENGCWVFLITKDEIDVLGSGEVKPGKPTKELDGEPIEDTEEEPEASAEPLNQPSGPGGLLPSAEPQAGEVEGPPPESGDFGEVIPPEEEEQEGEEEQEEEEPDEADALRDREDEEADKDKAMKELSKRRKKTKESFRSQEADNAFEMLVEKIVEDVEYNGFFDDTPFERFRGFRGAGRTALSRRGQVQRSSRSELTPQEYLTKMSWDLGMRFRNPESLDLEGTTVGEVVNWFKEHGFVPSRVVKGLWSKAGVKLFLDYEYGFVSLYD